MGVSSTGQWADHRTSGVVSADRVLRVIALVREGGEIDDSAEQQRHLLGGLARIVGAEVAVSFEFGGVGGTPTRGFIHGLTSHEERKVVGAYMEQGDGFDILAGHMRREFSAAPAPVLTCSRGELIADREWYRSSYVADFRRAWGIDHCIYSIHRIGSAYVGMSVNRGFDGTPFDDEARELVRIYQVECGWLAKTRAARAPAAEPTAGDRGVALPPRARDVLAGLLRGAPDKQIAADLGLSPHTVRQYVKVIYRNYDVGSRSELLAKHLSPR